MSKQRRATMIDVAKLAGVSQATVSLVINDKTDTNVKISDATRRRVLDAADRLQYRRNDAAIALVTGHFAAVQLFISNITDPFFDEFIHGVEVEALASGYHLYVRSTRFSGELERSSFSELRKSMVDGVIVCGSGLSKEDRTELARENRIIFINEQPSFSGGNVVVEDETGYEEAIQALLAAGLKRYAFITGPATRPTSVSRYDCFRRMATEAGASLVERDPIAAPQVALDLDEAFVDEVQALVGTVDVLFCFNDVLAIGIMLALQARGIRIPEEIGIVGFDGIVMGRIVRPALTTIEVPRYDLGREAMRLLCEMIEEGREDPRETITPFFVPRESHAPNSSG